MKISATLIGALVMAFTIGELAAQARIVEVFPEENTIRLERLGSTQAETVSVGTDLEPGDLLASNEARAKLECPPGSSVEVLLDPPFRVLIDVAEGIACTIDLMAGDVDILTDEPTQVTSGGVEMGSVATQYAVTVARGGDQPQRTLIVFDGEVNIRRLGGTEAKSIVRGQRLVAQPTVAFEVSTIDSADVKRSARQYATFDLAAATRGGAEIGDYNNAKRELTTLHSQVLTDPNSKNDRAALAKKQIALEIPDRAVYQLDRANLLDADRLRIYEIDPVILERRTPAGGPVVSDLRPIDPSVVERTRVHTAVASNLAPRALALIEDGGYQEAYDLLSPRVNNESATSQELYAMAKALVGLNNLPRAAEAAKNALQVNREDQGLTEQQITELQVLLRQIR